LVVADVGDPAHPERLGSVLARARGHVSFVGHYAFVAGGGLNVIDVTNPKSPPVIGDTDVPGSPNVVAVSGETAFVSAGTGGLQAISIADPTRPTVIANAPTVGRACDVQIAGTYAFVADDSVGVFAVNIADPRHLRSAGLILRGNGSGIWSLAVSDGYAYAAEWPYGIRVLDVSSPLRPRIVGQVPVPYISHVTVAGSYAYASDEEGLHVVDIADPRNPRLLGNVWIFWSEAACVVGTRAYVISG
jgi:hypothetical protein